MCALSAAACSSDDKGAAPASSAPTTIAPAPVTTAGATTTSVAPSKPPELTFGFIASSQPLLWDIGFAQQNAMSLAIDDVNAGGGVLGAPVDGLTAGSNGGGTPGGARHRLNGAGGDAPLRPVGSAGGGAPPPPHPRA